MKFRTLVTVAIFSMSLLPSVGYGAEFRALASWDQTFPVRPKFLDLLLKNVETASKGDMKFTINGPETVPPFEQLQPTSAGVFQILLTHAAYHIGQTPYLVAVEGMGGDLNKWRDARVREAIDAHYQKFGLKLLALGQTPPRSAVHFMLRRPLGPSGDLQGRKIRGTQTTAGTINISEALRW
jgi:TRAP-type mannitol/chloroaromatic compound transport system substrate-binding protein